MNNEELGKLDNQKIKFMIDNKLIGEDPYLEDVGNYLTTVYLGKYIDKCIKDNSIYIRKEKRKSIIEVFQRMRKKYNYAYYVKNSLNKLVCENKQKSIFTFVKDNDNRYPRIVFTNYSNLNEYCKIELNPEYYQPDILEKCLTTMFNIKFSSKYVFEIYKNIDGYKYIRDNLNIPKRILSQLEMRYIFHQSDLNPYEIIENKHNIVELLQIGDESIEFSEVLEYLNIKEKCFYDISQKEKPSNGMFINELTHLKKYVTLEYIYKKQLYPYFIDKRKFEKEEYETCLKGFIKDYMDELQPLYKLLVIPFKTYDVLEFHSKKYKRIFNYYKSQGYSKWQTQEIMRRYRYITEQMQLEPPEELLDMVEMFLIQNKLNCKEEQYL